jgi:hypothetical protein
MRRPGDRTVSTQFANACMICCRNFRGIVVDKVAVFIDELVGVTDIGLGLLHVRHL